MIHGETKRQASTEKRLVTRIERAVRIVFGHPHRSPIASSLRPPRRADRCWAKHVGQRNPLLLCRLKMASEVEIRHLPKPHESGRIQRRVSDGILNLLVPKVVLDQPKVAALVRKVVAATVPQQVRIRLHRQPGALACLRYDAPERAAAHFLRALRAEEILAR